MCMFCTVTVCCVWPVFIPHGFCLLFCGHCVGCKAIVLFGTLILYMVTYMECGLCLLCVVGMLCCIFSSYGLTIHYTYICIL